MNKNQKNKNRGNNELYKKNTGNVFLQRANKINIGDSINLDNQINDKPMQTNSQTEDASTKTKIKFEILQSLI